MDRKLNILVPTSYYLPGFKGGGPIRSVSNLVEQMGDDFEFVILTADRDLGDLAPYPTVTPNVWQTVGKAQVMYLPPDQMTFGAWGKLLTRLDHDLIYLQSFFAPLTRHTLLLRRLGKIADRPVILAPRGEFSSGALGIKSRKKRTYIKTALRLGLCDDLIWHATDQQEGADMARTLAPLLADSMMLRLASPITAGHVSGGSQPAERVVKKQALTLRIVFLSRISRKKNLDFALAALQHLEEDAIFDIYGPIEDRTYWQECEQIIGALPPNVKATYCGEVTHDQVSSLLKQYHLFFLPTRGENFGHAIAEALTAGLPVLISDQTPWCDLETKGVGWDIPLMQPERFRQALRQVGAMDQAEFSAWSDRARQLAAEFEMEQNEIALPAYRRMFEDAARGH